MESQKNKLVIYDKKIYADQITAELRERWGLSKDEATLCFRNLRNNLHLPNSYHQTRLVVYTADFSHKRLSYGELIQHLAVLALYAEALSTNKLKHGYLIQEWNPALGWHPVINHMFSVAHTPKHTPTGPDPCMLAHTLKTPHDILQHLYRMFGFYCDARQEAQTEGMVYLSCPVQGDVVRLGTRYSEEIVFLFTKGKTRQSFSLTLKPNFTTGVPRNFEGTYRLSVKWDTDAATPLANFAMEELIAKSIPFGPMELGLPLLKASTKGSA